MLFKVGSKSKPVSTHYQDLDTHHSIGKLLVVSKRYVSQTKILHCNDKQWHIVKTADFTIQVQTLSAVMDRPSDTGMYCNLKMKVYNSLSF